MTPEKEDLKFVLRSMKGDSELLQLLSERLKLSPAVFSDINALIDHLYNKDDGDDITWGRAISILEENPPLVKKKLNGLSNINLASAVKEFISKNEIYIKYKSCVPVYSSALNNAIQTKGAVKVFFSKITVSGPPRSGRATIANRLLHEANLVKGICSESDSKFRVFHMKSPREVSTRSSLEESAHVNDATSQHVKHQERDNNKGEENPMMNPEEEPTMEEPSSGSTSEPKPTLEAEITVHELPKEEFVIDDIEGPTDIKPSSNNSPHLTEENSSLRSSFQKTTQSGQSPASRPNRFRNFAKVTNNLLKLRSETSAKRAVKSDDGDIQLIHIINSGGQPAFLDIAPALLRYTPVNILTCVLNDGLENKPKFDYIIGDECIEEPEEHRLTNLQLLESSFRSLASVSPHHPRGIHAKFSDKKPHFLIVGNQFDGMKKSNETLEDKDVVLWSTLGHYCDMELVINFDETREKIIFPLNAVEYTEQEIKMIQKIYNAIAKYNIEAEIPTHWFYFKTFLDEHEGSKKESIISKAECVKLGIEECQMKDETEVVHALMFFHDLTILSYFADILPDVVFLHPKPLLDKLSELICISFPKAISILQEKTGNCIPAGAHVNMKTKGIFKRNLLTSFLTEGFKDYFTADHFITLMQSLFVIAPLPGKDQYFLPSALPTATLKQNEKQPFTNNVEPLVLTWKLNPIPKGLFPALVINLLHHPEPLKFELLQSWPQYRNAIRLICKNIGGRILLVDDVVWFEIYYDGPVEECSKIRSVILDCIAKVVDNFHYVKSIKTPEECFRCHDNRDISGKAPEGKQAHLCSLNERKTMLTCHDHGVKRVNEKYQPWFSTEVSSKFLPTSLCTIISFITRYY